MLDSVVYDFPIGTIRNLCSRLKTGSLMEASTIANREFSSDGASFSCIPQGLIPCPLLWNIFISELKENKKSELTMVADDTEIDGTEIMLRIETILLSGLDHTINSAHLNKMPFKTVKTRSCIRTKSVFHPYKVNEVLYFGEE